MTMHAPRRPVPKPVLDAEAVSRSLSRIAHEVIERNPDLGSVALVGIHTRGVPLARRLQGLIAERSGVEVELGALDITHHRDDTELRGRPEVHATELGFELAGRTCVLVDDVLYTGRTVRAAMDALLEHGRPERIQLAVLADRGHRELPIRPDYVGKNLPTARDERVTVRLLETDGVDEVVLVRVAEDAEEDA
jgi:pyrimidine operon attenuation protein / uracil phosphoribosyltransferase